jgi:hypothetical protein
MQQRKEDTWVYLPLALLSSAYVVILDRKKAQIEPDYAWLEVVLGTAMCLTAAAIRARLGPDDRATYERAVWLAFAVAGLPIIIWQNRCAYQRQKRRGDALQQYLEERYGTHERASPTLAALRWPRPPAHGTDR